MRIHLFSQKVPGTRATQGGTRRFYYVRELNCVDVVEPGKRSASEDLRISLSDVENSLPAAMDKALKSAGIEVHVHILVAVDA